MPVLVLHNPAARSGRARRCRPALVAALADAGLDAEVVETRGPGSAERLARQAGSVDLVVAAGGDGTVCEVVNGLAAHGPGGPALGVVPLGTGDDFARALGVPRRLDAAVRALAATPPVAVDLGEASWDDDAGAHVRRFANCLGAGFDAEATALAADTKWLGGRSAYLAAVLRTLWARQRRDARVLVGGAEAFAGPLFLCEVANGPAIGGGFRLTPDAVLDDGRLDVCLARDMAPGRALRLLPLAVAGRHGAAPEVSIHQAERVEVEASTPLALQADGDVVSFSARRVGVRVLPGAVRVVAPGLAGRGGVRGVLVGPPRPGPAAIGRAAGGYDS